MGMRDCLFQRWSFYLPISTSSEVRQTIRILRVLTIGASVTDGARSINLSVSTTGGNLLFSIIVQTGVCLA